MKKMISFPCLLIIAFLIAGCGSQNEYLSKGKEWVKSDKRGRIPKAISQFELAIEKEPDNAEAHYLLGYYDENATIERRAEQMVLAYKYDKRKYLKILIDEAIRDRDEKVRQSALKALMDIHKNMDSLIKPLVKTLKAKDSRDRDNAALVLSKLHNPKEVLDRLMQDDILKHKRMSTRFSAVRALGNIGHHKAIDPLMERITALKTEDEKGEEPEVRRAAVVALRQIAKRNIEITDKSFNVQVEPDPEGVKVTGGTDDKLTIQKDEIISHIIDNKEIKNLDEFNVLVGITLQDSKEINFRLPKIVKVTVSNIEELGISNIKSGDNGIIVGNLTVDSRAAKRGVEKGEMISYINDQPVKSQEDFDRIVSEVISKGEAINFRIGDEDKYSLITVPISEDTKTLGMTVENLPYGAEGVIVTAIQPRSPAIEAGVRKGQIISSMISKKEIRNIDEYNKLLQEGLADGKVIISVINKTANGKLIEVLRDKGLIVRFDAAQALGEIEDKKAVDSLINMLQEQTNPIEISLK